MKEYFMSENLKIKNTFLKKLIWLMPLITMAITYLLESSAFQCGAYNSWYVIIIPGAASLTLALLGKIDDKMKQKAVLSLPVDLKKVWIAKVLVGIKIIFISSAIIFIGTQLYPIFVGDESKRTISFLAGLFAVLMITIAYAWQVPLYLFLQKKINLFATVMISIFVNFFSSIIAVKSFWFVNPFCYTARTMCPILKILPNGLSAQPGSKTFTPEILELWSVPFSIVVSLVLLIIFILITAKWYAKQEAV